MKLLIFTFCLFANVSATYAAAPILKIQGMLAKPAIMCGRFDQSKQLNGMTKPLLSNGRFCVVAAKSQ